MSTIMKLESTFRDRYSIKWRLSENFRAATGGLLGGSLATVVLHPLDLLKTRQAVLNSSKYNGIIKAFGQIIKYEGGVTSLYKGVGANMILSGSSWGIYFLSYNMLKENLADVNSYSTSDHLISAFGAGMATTVLTNPMGVVRTRMVTCSNPADKRYKSVTKTLRFILQNEGLCGLYKGLWPSICNISHGTIQFLIYEYLKRHISNDKPATTSQILISSSVSKMIAAFLTYPFQNLRARQQASEGGNNSKAINLRNIIRYEGYSSLYRGIIPYLIHVVPNVCIVFIAYETVVRNFNQ